MKFKLIKEINKENWNNKIYSNGYYNVSIRKNNYIDVVICKCDNEEIDINIKYLPTIFINTDLYTDEYIIEDMTIQTTSYGTLSVKEIEEVVKGYNIALETVKELKELLKEYMKYLEFVRLCDDFKILCKNLNYDILKDVNIILDLYENGVININDCNSLQTDVLSWYEGLIDTNDFIEEIKIIYEY